VTDPDIQVYLRGTFPGTSGAYGSSFGNTLVPAASGAGTLFNVVGKINKADSGTHADFIGVNVNFSVVANAVSTLTNATGIKITAPTGATNNYALWVASGQARLGTDVRFGTRTAIGAETVTGYITITDDGGTTRKIAVVS